MSYQEKNVTVSLMSYILILGYFVVTWLQMYRKDDLDSSEVFRLWITVLVVTILVNITASILTNIVLSILHAIRTGGKEEERFIEDERDKLIGLKGTQASYITFSIGVFLAMLTFVFGQPPLLMFSLIVLSGILAEIVGDLSQLIRYRRGF